jgi:hypothetical protein
MENSGFIFTILSWFFSKMQPPDVQAITNSHKILWSFIKMKIVLIKPAHYYNDGEIWIAASATVKL